MGFLTNTCRHAYREMGGETSILPMFIIKVHKSRSIGISYLCCRFRFSFECFLRGITTSDNILYLVRQFVAKRSNFPSIVWWKWICHSFTSCFWLLEMSDIIICLRFLHFCRMDHCTIACFMNVYCCGQRIYRYITRILYEAQPIQTDIKPPVTSDITPLHWSLPLPCTY